ncbi:PAS domain-containing protein [Flavicella marina]|uniref:PAS domain-containing protein n=1 Tax=Flavicella marina TaxID=1475951 RepID=UPI0012655B06|nr:PAS domain-containing protein [Flavicella marina]
MSWDIYSQFYFDTIQNLKIHKDISFVKSFAKKEKWKNDIDLLFKNSKFEALVITDVAQKIVWVNDGFTKMTGYSKKHALDKKPSFLQGEATSDASKKSFRNKLNKLQPFTQIITNYRKDKTTYKCEVKIIPMYADDVTHFLALEREIV